MATGELLTRSVAKLIPEKLAKEKLASKEKLRVYWGIDPTGGKIHLGHTIPMRKLQQFADAGHHAILLIGSFTAMLGDPSDKDSMRKPLTKEEVEKNLKTYKEQASKVIDFNKVEIVFNHEWLEKLTYEDIIHHTSLFTVQQMEQRDAFERRMKDRKPLGVHEFLYPAMVGYDSVHLDVDCEIGGTDQEFNMLAGRTMQKAMGKRDKFVLTTPLIEGVDGRLMSKTYENCIYLEDEPSDMYGKVMSMNDDLMETYFECCTDVETKEYKKVLKGNPKEAKMCLAREIVTLYHNEKAAQSAEEEFTKVFSDKGTPTDIPEVKVKKETTLVDILTKEKLVSSKSEFRRLVEQGGIHMNDKTVKDPAAEAEEGIVKVGKRKFLKVIYK